MTLFPLISFPGIVCLEKGDGGLAVVNKPSFDLHCMGVMTGELCSFVTVFHFDFDSVFVSVSNCTLHARLIDVVY